MNKVIYWTLILNLYGVIHKSFCDFQHITDNKFKKHRINTLLFKQMPKRELFHISLHKVENSLQNYKLRVSAISWNSHINIKHLNTKYPPPSYLASLISPVQILSPLSSPVQGWQLWKQTFSGILNCSKIRFWNT